MQTKLEGTGSPNEILPPGPNEILPPGPKPIDPPEMFTFGSVFTFFKVVEPDGLLATRI